MSHPPARGGQVKPHMESGQDEVHKAAPIGCQVSHNIEKSHILLIQIPQNQSGLAEICCLSPFGLAATSCCHCGQSVLFLAEQVSVLYWEALCGSPCRCLLFQPGLHVLHAFQVHRQQSNRQRTYQDNGNAS